MSRFIEVDSICAEGETLINVDQIISVIVMENGNTALIFNGEESNYMEIENSYEEIKQMILND